MREIATKTIDGHEYTFSQFGAKQSVRYLTRLSKIVGKPLALALGSFEGTGKNLLDKKLNTNALALALEALAGNLEQDEALSLIEGFVGNDAVLCDGQRIVFDLHYQGQMSHMFKVLAAALEVQYGNFFGALTDLMPKAPPLPANSAPQT